MRHGYSTHISRIRLIRALFLHLCLSFAYEGFESVPYQKTEMVVHALAKEDFNPQREGDRTGGGRRHRLVRCRQRLDPIYSTEEPAEDFLCSWVERMRSLRTF